MGKSLWISKIADHWTLNNEARVARLVLESPMDFHLLRSLSQIIGRTDILREEFHANNIIESKAIVAENRTILNKIGKTITTSDTGLKKSINHWDYKAVLKWLEYMAPTHDVLIVDPVSIILSNSPWLESAALTKGAEEIMSNNKHLCIVWVSHPSAEEGQMAGGRAWQKYTSVNLEIHAPDEPEVYEILLPNGDLITKEVSLYFKVKKCRSGSALNWKIAMSLNQDNLTLYEEGRMLRRIKN